MANRYSSFPSVIDSLKLLPEYQELSDDKKNIIARYTTLLQKGSSITSTELEELNTIINTQLNDVMITSIDWNKLAGAVINMEDYYVNTVLVDISNMVNQKETEFTTLINNKTTEFNNVVTNKTSEFQTEIDQFTDRGTFNPTVQYYKRNTVQYNGETYLAKQDTLGNVPMGGDSDLFWQKIAQKGAKGDKGDTGANGIGIVFRGEYSDTTTYAINEAVQYQGSLYQCIKATTGNLPTNTTYWTLAVSKGGSTVVTTLKNTVTLAIDSINVPLGISAYNQYTDGLFVYKNSTYIEKDKEYVINANGTSIDKIDGTTWAAGTVFNFVIIKNIVTNITYQDGGMLQDGTVSKNKLTTDVQDTLDKVGTEVLNTTAQDLSGSVNELKYELDITNQNLSDFQDSVETHLAQKAAQSDVDAINVKLENYNSYASSVDSNGIYTVVEYKRADGTLYMKSTLSGGTSPNYTTDTWQFYDVDGSTLLTTKTWTITYDENGKITSKVVA